MKSETKRQRKTKPWIISSIALGAASAFLIGGLFCADVLAFGGDVSWVQVLFELGSRAALTALPEVMVALLGIAITVVAIIVELAANRYTPRISELFVRTPTNLVVLGFFVITSLLCIATSLLGTGELFIARLTTTVTVVAVCLSLLILLPYFAFVFYFLSPHNVIDHMGRTVLRAVNDARRRPRRVAEARVEAVGGIEQLSDVALNAAENKDKALCMHAVVALGSVAEDYRRIKNEMPESWFAVGNLLAENSDFVSMEPRVLSDIEEKRYWFEMKVLRQFQMIYGETLNRLRDINYLVAIQTRQLATSALDEGDEQTARLAVKFFNTYLRATNNAADVRTAYNVFNQYRLLAEYALKNGREEVAIEIAERFQYYGQLGFGLGLPFVLEASAYDLCTLGELAFDLGSTAQEAILSVILDVDKEADKEHELESSLRGVRKAQIKLATYYLQQGAPELARRIFDDMVHELPSRLRSIRRELVGVRSRDFWEINDRGINFDYLDPARREKLAEFFLWFEDASIHLASRPPLRGPQNDKEQGHC